MSDLPEEVSTPITQLSRAQRRVLGVLIEKGFTTPEVYPLTLKATTTACNQKSNRDPVVNYDEDKVEQVLDELRQLGLAAVVHTESGRSARYRHYMRHKFTLSEAQLAILTELLLRGQQQLGELRTRASRMVPIDSLEQLRSELNGLIEMKLVQADGPLERRGIEVDHTFYAPNEQRPVRTSAPPGDDADEPQPEPRASQPVAAPAPAAADQQFGARFAALEATCEELRSENEQLRESVETLKEDFRRLSDAFDDLRRALGG